MMLIMWEFSWCTQKSRNPFGFFHGEESSVSCEEKENVLKRLQCQLFAKVVTTLFQIPEFEYNITSV